MSMEHAVEKKTLGKHAVHLETEQNNLMSIELHTSYLSVFMFEDASSLFQCLHKKSR